MRSGAEPKTCLVRASIIFVAIALKQSGDRPLQPGQG